MVIDGASRDIDEARELNFPVYARGAVPMIATCLDFKASTVFLKSIPPTCGSRKTLPALALTTLLL